MSEDGAIVWAYFRDSGGEAQEHNVGQRPDVGIVHRSVPNVAAISNANDFQKPCLGYDGW
jgi:hypothetical protein